MFKKVLLYTALWFGFCLALSVAITSCNHDQHESSSPCSGGQCPVVIQPIPQDVTSTTATSSTGAVVVVDDNTAVPVSGNNDLAVLVGINRYPGAPLSGCVNDVKAVHVYLVRDCGFREDQIIELLDEQATKANIVAALTSFTATAREGDRRVYHASGHGTEDVIDVVDEPDHINQIFCPVDFAWTANTMLIDKEFVAILSKMPAGVKLNGQSDSCYSGGLFRPIQKPGRKIGKREWPNIPPATAARVAAAKARGIRNKGMVNGLLDVGYVSGCGSKQTSADVQDSSGAYGAFTHYWIQVQRAHPTNTVRMNTAILGDTLNSNGFDQVPEAAGARIDRPFLK